MSEFDCGFGVRRHAARAGALVRRRILIATALALGAGAASAQDKYPSRVIRFVTAPPGSNHDWGARFTALVRGIVAIAWYGIQTFLASVALVWPLVIWMPWVASITRIPSNGRMAFLLCAFPRSYDSNGQRCPICFPQGDFV